MRMILMNERWDWSFVSYSFLLLYVMFMNIALLNIYINYL